MTTASATTSTSAPTSEHRDLLEALQAHRGFLRFTANGLSDEQANQRSTVSALTIAKIIKHVAETEEIWIDFVLNGPDAFPSTWGDWEPAEGETLAVLLDRYETVAARTDALVAGGLDLDASQPLPVAPWFPPNASRSARRVLVHIVAETAQHAGHADVIRESIDGQKTMG